LSKSRTLVSRREGRKNEAAPPEGGRNDRKRYGEKGQQRLERKKRPRPTIGGGASDFRYGAGRVFGGEKGNRMTKLEPIMEKSKRGNRVSQIVSRIMPTGKLPGKTIGERA